MRWRATLNTGHATSPKPWCRASLNYPNTATICGLDVPPDGKAMSTGIRSGPAGDWHTWQSAAFSRTIGCRYNRGVGLTMNRENADAFDGKRNG
jgi:hypothetical protein